MREVVIVEAVRTPVGPLPRQIQAGVRADHLGAVVLDELDHGAPGSSPSRSTT
jgi:acetyl-CoA acetyltransferase